MVTCFFETQCRLGNIACYNLSWHSISVHISLRIHRLCRYKHLSMKFATFILCRSHVQSFSLFITSWIIWCCSLTEHASAGDQHLGSFDDIFFVEKLFTLRNELDWFQIIHQPVFWFHQHHVGVLVSDQMTQMVSSYPVPLVAVMKNGSHFCVIMHISYNL